MFSQLLLLTMMNRALKLDYASVIFVDPGVHIDETYLDYLTTIHHHHHHDAKTAEVRCDDSP